VKPENSLKKKIPEEWLDPFNPFNSWKSLAWAQHMQGIVDGELLPPVVVNWDLVLGCIYKCRWCMWRKRQKLPNSMVPPELVRRIPKFLHDWGVKACCLAGDWGDPTQHPDLPTALRLLHYWNIDVGLTNNGFLLGESLTPFAAHYTKFTGFSVDAGTADSYAAVHNTPPENFTVVIKNIEHLANYAQRYSLPVQIGYKFLIFPESYRTLYEAARIAREIGARDFQIRPAHLPVSATRKINIDEVNEQIQRARELETKSFRIFGIRHKFTPTFEKKQPEHCWATPLTSTWCADGKIVACVDLRDEEYNTLCNYITDELDEVKRVWGSKKHLNIIRELNQHLDNCKRCTNYMYNEIIENAFVQDKMDVRLI